MKKPAKKLLQRYLISGAGVGLYFGLFFRPVGEPNFIQPILLGILGGLVTAGYRLWRVPPSNSMQAIRQAFYSVLAFTAFLVMMELRHFANAYGGKIAVILLSTGTGLVMGLAFAYYQSSPAGKKN